MSVIVPPIKSQGIKTKLVPWIFDYVYSRGVSMESGWVEPFFGTGVVGFNAPFSGRRLVGDTNPHLIAFYSGIQEGLITPDSMRTYLEESNRLLSSSPEDGYSYYREVRDRFNREHSSYDFLFLSRAGFNGMMRFSRKGDWNIPFCKKPNRFAPSYVTKICNQISRVGEVIRAHDWTFEVGDFERVISQATKHDVIYCDPPYFGRYVDYYNGWTEKDEERLFGLLCETPARFILSTWHHNEFRDNEMISRLWNRFNIVTKEHFYHGGGHIENRHAIVEALVTNF